MNRRLDFFPIKNKPLLILDLEGTTGIYSSSMHQNDTIMLRHGFYEFLQCDPWFDYAIATRAPKFFITQIEGNLEKAGLKISQPIYSKEDIEIGNQNLGNYKYIQHVCEDKKIHKVESTVVIMGDFLRFTDNDDYSANDYLSHDFVADPSHLILNNSLNDHPYPINGEIPIYLVLPQPWTTKDYHGNHISLSFNFALFILRKLWELGTGNFAEGYKNLGSSDLFQKVEIKAPNMEHNQRYLILKGESKDWQPMVKIA
ncbi:hypothetical protein VC188_11105 [Polynucleobacter sp. MG-28-Ekke-A2]|uniref:hypothetical protein n=1 Tax=Polynucleobacter sp. MG-28-Ekke-A2 TaxID=3108276 RepID=UPI002B235E3A|nr:hypothetical protein [Polynucleobacter sp. MG-28-Ekke-A2]MEA9602666.1 hypothetical protein [Polynucleobacter sp. MG-28-Ekke-A2]